MVFQPANWAYSYSMTVDYTKIDSDLVNFPVKVVLVSGTGIDPYDENGIYTVLSENNNEIDDYDVLIWRALWDSSPKKHKFSTTDAISISEPGPFNFEIALNFISGGTYSPWLLLDNSLDWNIEGDYTIEFWMKTADTGDQTLLSFGSTSNDNLVIKLNYNAGIYVYWDSAGATKISYGAVGEFSDNVWRHCALVRKDQEFRLYLQGVMVGKNTCPSTLSTVNNDRDYNYRHFIGANYDINTENFYGSMAGLRISNMARYTSGGFTLPKSNFTSDDNTLLLIQDKTNYSNTYKYNWNLISKSNTHFQWSSDEEPFGRALLLHNNQRLYTTDNLDNFRIGEGGESFTIDFWFMLNRLQDDNGFFALVGDTTNPSWDGYGYYYYAYIGSDEVLHFRSWDGGTSYNDLVSISLASGDVNKNTWYHVAFINDSELDNFSAYYMGRRIVNTTAKTFQVPIEAARFYIGDVGAVDPNTYGMRGGIANLRISKGIARWKSRFDPPSAPYGVGSKFNNRKIAFTTTVSGVEEELFAELDMWYDGNMYVSNTVAYQANNTFVKVTSRYDSNYYEWYATNKWEDRFGSYAGNAWLSNSTTGWKEQKYNIDYGRPVIPDRVCLDNIHNTGTNTIKGVKNFRVYGTNSYTAFTNTTYSDTTDLTLLGTFQARQRWNGDSTYDLNDSQYFYLTNPSGIAYRYYVFRLEDNFQGSQYMGFRYIEIQTLKKNTDIYVKLPTVSSTSGTVLNLYYDNTQTDNDSYIGNFKDAAATYVWDEDYIGVYHLSRFTLPTSPFNSDNAIDSTVNDHHFDSQGNIYARDTGFYDDVHFRPDNTDYFNNTTILTVYDTGITLEGFSNCRESSTYDAFISVGTSNYNAIMLSAGANTNLVYSSNGSTWTTNITHADTSFEYNYLAASIDGSGYIHRVNDSVVSGSDGVPYLNNTTVQFGRHYSGNTSYYFHGAIDEIRLSKIKRSDAWLRASYFTNTDNLLTYETGQIAPYVSYVFEGTVYDWSGTASGVPIRAYVRSDGRLSGETLSTSSGTFQIICSSIAEHYITALNPYTGTNAIIFDRITPSGIII